MKAIKNVKVKNVPSATFIFISGLRPSISDHCTEIQFNHSYRIHKRKNVVRLPKLS